MRRLAIGTGITFVTFFAGIALFAFDRSEPFFIAKRRFALFRRIGDVKKIDAMDFVIIFVADLFADRLRRRNLGLGNAADAATACERR